MIIKNIRLMSKVYVLPTDTDILCGRGMHNFKHPGNTSLRTKIFLKLDSYLTCTRKRDKTTIIRSVIDEVLEEGGRFLKNDPSNKFWYDGGPAAAKIRVGVGFRDAKNPDKVRYVKNMRESLGKHEDSARSHSSSNLSSSLLDLVVVPPRNSSESGSALSSPEQDANMRQQHGQQDSTRRFPLIHSSSALSSAAVPTRTSSAPISSGPHLAARIRSTQHTEESPVLRAVASPFQSTDSLVPLPPLMQTAQESSKRKANDFPKASVHLGNDRKRESHTVETTKYLLEALARSHVEDSYSSEGEDDFLSVEGPLEELETVKGGSTSAFWDAFKRERLVRLEREPPTNEDDASLNDDSLFSDGTLNEIFGTVDEASLPWEPFLSENEY